MQPPLYRHQQIDFRVSYGVPGIPQVRVLLTTTKPATSGLHAETEVGGGNPESCFSTNVPRYAPPPTR